MMVAVVWPLAVTGVLANHGSKYQVRDFSERRTVVKSPLTCFSYAHNAKLPTTHVSSIPRKAKNKSGFFMSFPPIFRRFQQNRANRKIAMPAVHRMARRQKLKRSL